VLTTEDLLAIEPFGNHVVHAQFKPDVSLSALLAEFEERAGPLVVHGRQGSAHVSNLVTTSYLAETLSVAGPPATVLDLSQAVRHVLCSEVMP
jgi:hypothetical protein